MSEPTKNKAFKDVIDKFIHIGNCYYNGKHFDNVLNIFSDLTEEDKKIFLRSVHQIYSVVEMGVGNLSLEVSKTKIDNEPDTSENYNSKLMIETKFWFIRAFGISCIIGLLVFIILILFFASGVSGNYGNNSIVWKILSLMFK